MSFEAAEAAVRAYFTQQWANITPIAWPDLPFVPPHGTWVRFSMKNNIGAQESIGSPGSNLYRRRGVVAIQVFQKAGQASTEARKKSDVAVNAFMANQLPGFTFENVNARDIGPDGAGWYQWNVTAEYRYDITR
jgi:hypothetical protein